MLKIKRTIAALACAAGLAFLPASTAQAHHGASLADMHFVATIWTAYNPAWNNSTGTTIGCSWVPGWAGTLATCGITNGGNNYRYGTSSGIWGGTCYRHVAIAHGSDGSYGGTSQGPYTGQWC